MFAPIFIPVLSSSVERPTIDWNFALAKALDPRATFTRASAGTYIDEAGTIQSAATNVPRFEHDQATRTCQGLLIEESRTNLLLNSAALATQSVAVSAVAYTLSFWGTGTVTLSGVSTAGPLVGTGANNRVTLTFTPTAGSLTLTVSGSVNNAQLEAGSFATAWVSTAGASATRAADVCSAPTAGLLRADRGTVLVDYAVTPAMLVTGARRTLLDRTGDAGNNRFILRARAEGATSAPVFAYGTGSAVVSLTGANYGSVGQAIRLAVSYSPAGVTLAQNGVIVATSTTAPSISETADFSIGNAGGAGQHACVALARLRIWPVALSDVRLQTLTAL